MTEATATTVLLAVAVTATVALLSVSVATMMLAVGTAKRFSSYLRYVYLQLHL